MARLFGMVWERHDDHSGAELEDADEDAAGKVGENYIVRWDAQLLTDVARSLLTEVSDLNVIRFWNHAPVVGLLDRSLWWIGNNMVGIVVKNATPPASASA